MHYILLLGIALTVLLHIQLFTKELSRFSHDFSGEDLGIGAFILFETVLGCVVFAVLYGYRWAIDVALTITAVISSLLPFAIFAVKKDMPLFIVFAIINIFMMLTYIAMRKKWKDPSSDYA